MAISTRQLDPFDTCEWEDVYWSGEVEGGPGLAPGPGLESMVEGVDVGGGDVGMEVVELEATAERSGVITTITNTIATTTTTTTTATTFTNNHTTTTNNTTTTTTTTTTISVSPYQHLGGNCLRRIYRPA